MKKLIATIALFASFSVSALDITSIGDLSQADTKVIAGFKSFHYKGDGNGLVNENNPSIGVEMWDVQAIYVHKNSWSAKSLYLTYAPDYQVNDYLSMSANVGIATGYKCGMSVPVNKANKDKYGMSVPVNKANKDKYASDLELGHNCSNSGIMPLVGVTASYYPVKEGLSLSLTVTSNVAMFSIGYDL